MKGHIRSRAKDVHDVIIYLGRDPITGKRKYESKTIRGPKKLAEAYLHRVLTQIDQGTYVEARKITLAEFLERWLRDDGELTLQPKTRKSYSDEIKKHIIPVLGSIRLDRLRPEDLTKFYAEEARSGRLDGKGGLSNRTILYHHRILHAALQQAVKWGILARNVADMVDPPSPEKTEIDVLDEEQLKTFMDAVRGTRYYALYLVAATTGMRPSEVLGLRWQDVDLERGILTVQQKLSKAGQDPQFGPVKTRGSVRRVLLLPTVIEALRAHKAMQNEEKQQLGDTYRDYGLVFTVVNGGPIDRKNLVQRHFQPTLKRLGLPVIGLKDLRHTHATQLLRRGVHPKMVSERLGHSSIRITLDTYSHVVPDMQREVVQQLEEGLFGDSKAKD